MLALMERILGKNEDDASTNNNMIVGIQAKGESNLSNGVDMVVVDKDNTDGQGKIVVIQGDRTMDMDTDVDMDNANEKEKGLEELIIAEDETGAFHRARCVVS